MITWITVWVLTVSRVDSQSAYSHQLQYMTQETCEKQRQYHKGNLKASRCDFQQVPIVINK